MNDATIYIGAVLIITGIVLVGINGTQDPGTQGVGGVYAPMPSFDHGFQSGGHAWVTGAPDDASWRDINVFTANGTPIRFKYDGNDSFLDQGETLWLSGPTEIHHNATIHYQSRLAHTLRWDGGSA